jgi:acyl-CoA synthetase (AMP-forming)/AMP-acid ligase II
MEIPSSMDAVLKLRERAETAPESPAILAPGRPPLTYSGLWLRITDLRRRLTAAGVVQGHPIALVIPDGPDFMVTLLAVAGLGACAPLDPAASPDEYRYQFTHLRAPALVTLEGSSPGAVASAEAQGMHIFGLRYLPDYELASVALRSATGPCFIPRSADRSILLFTSSTTGQPKLVPQTNASMEAHCLYESRALALGSQDRLLCLAPLYHSLGLRAALSQLYHGGSVICAPRFDPNSLAGWLQEFRPTWICVGGAGLGAMGSLVRRHPEPWRGSSLRFIRSGASAPDPRLMLELEQLLGIPVLDCYGSTEASAVTRGSIHLRKAGSLGQSMGATIAIQDEAGNCLEPGKQGEIVVRGPTVMSGYLDDEEANRRAFRNGWFRMGDVGYLDEDGFLFLTGRLAEMINRGGRKVAPRQVENVLEEHPAVREAAVFGIRHKTLGEEVAAAVVLRSQVVSELDLRRFASERLTLYKVPHYILFVESLPRNHAGKIQRKQLSEQYHQLAMEQQPSQALATETATALATIWREEIGCGPIGLEGDFFGLGGDSLSAAVVAARIRVDFGVNVEPRVFFEHPRLQDFSRAVGELMQQGEEILPQLERAARGRPFPLSYVQQRVWQYAFEESAAEGCFSVNYNAVMAHLLRGALDAEILGRAVQHLTARHEILRTAFEHSDAGPVQVVHPSGACELSVLDFSNRSAPAALARRVLRDEAAKPFLLGHAPLVRFVLVRLSTDEHWLIRVSHHLAADAHTWRVGLTELGSLYEELLSGRTPRLPAAPLLDYADFALCQRREVSPAAPGFGLDVDWWAARFSGCRRPPRLSFHEAVNRATLFRPRLSSADPGEGLVTWGLQPEISARLNQLQTSEGVTHYQTRLTAFAALLAEMTQAPDALLGAFFSLRNRLEWQNVMGDFSNLLSMLLPFEGARTFRESLREVSRQVVETAAHGSIPYELLREALQARGVAAPEITVILTASEHTAPIRFGGVELTWQSPVITAMPWGFTMDVDRHNEDRLCNVTFDPRLYHPEAVRSFVARYTRLLDAASRHPDLPMQQLLEMSQ